MLVLAIILNPRSKKAVHRGEQKSRAGDSDGSGGDHDGGTARLAAIIGGQDNKDRNIQEDHLTSITV